MKKTAIILSLCMLIAILAGCGSSKPSAVPAPTPAPAPLEAYVFTCADSNGKGIEGVILQVCTDETCTLFTSDADGLVKCDGLAPMVYEVHVLKCPEGFTYDRDAVYKTSDSFEAHTFTLQAK